MIAPLQKEPKVFCRECKALMALPKDKSEAMVALTINYCGLCYFWHQLEVVKNSPDSVRIGGKHYFIGKETSLEEDPPKWRGIAGAKVIIKFFDGRTVTSTNFWYNGVIPDRWKNRLPENAEFIKHH